MVVLGFVTVVCAVVDEGLRLVIVICEAGDVKEALPSLTVAEGFIGIVP
jgi:hypothetical protein